jgi:hypothetical protein
MKRGTDALPLNGRRKIVMRVTQGLLPLLAVTYAATIVINIVMRIVIVCTTSSLTCATDLGLCPKSNLPDFFLVSAATLQPRHWKVKGSSSWITTTSWDRHPHRHRPSNEAATIIPMQ